MKLKTFCTAKETINKKERQPTESEKILSSHKYDKSLVPKTYKEFTQLNNKKNNLI